MAEKSYDKISPTAIDVAFVRAHFTNMPFAREIFQLARKFAHIPLYERVPSSILRLAIFFPHSVESVAGLEIRYLSTNMILETLGETWAIVEIAAGISARSLEWAGRQTHYIETDLPEMLETKQSIFNTIASNKGIEDNSNHAFMPLNALNSSDWNALGEKYFAGRNLKIAVVNEGLLGYLSPEEKRQLRDNIRNFLTMFAAEGMWLSPDFVNQPSYNLTWISKRIQRNTERKTMRPLDRFSDRGEIVNFLQQGGFRVDFPPNDEILDKLTCIPKMHLKRERVRPLLSLHQTCCAKLM
ncbi:MAG TPA: class I SAM-dependent methyltransferase [Candidatus Lokiarchaeia archaeon]|nr:class I SAM-dependent methyltransferase [Candidatus Lokiarchaeia archaeon]